MSETVAKRGLLGNLVTSFHLAVASIRLVGQHRTVLLLPACTLAVVTLLVVAPLSLLTWGIEHHPEATGDFFETLYFVTVAAAKAGNWGLAVSAAIIETYLLLSLWMIPVLTAVLYFSTAGMHVATQQIKRETPDLRAAFAVANANLGRLFALAAFNATIYAWGRYIVFVGLGSIPVAGTWIVRGLRLALNAVTYVMLPIVVYERAGAREAFRSAWRQIRKTWSGLLVGSSLVFFAMFFLFEVFIWGVAQQTIGVATSGILSLIAGAFLYALSTAAAAAFRAVLYWYATTGEVPPGFPAERLPQIGEHTGFTMDITTEQPRPVPVTQGLGRRETVTARQ
jgi:hypothetical protein